MNNLEQLRLTKMSAYLPEYLDQINGKQLSFTEAMLNLTKAELDWRQGEHVDRIIKRARFPQVKLLKAFDLSLIHI